MVFHLIRKLINHFAPVIQIDKVNTTHDGTYECKASNAFGQQQVTFYVTITGEYIQLVWH